MRLLAALPMLLALVAPSCAASPSPGHDLPRTGMVARGRASTVPRIQLASPRAELASPRAELVEPLRVLREWDALRASAWARADEHALRALYVSGSGAGLADVRLLRAYQSRGVVVRRLVTQVFAVRILRSDQHLVRLLVFDRVAGGGLLVNGDPVALASSRPTVRTVELRRSSGRWRVWQTTARPVARTR